MKELVWMEEIITGRMKGREMSGSVSGEGRYAAIIRSIVEESPADWFKLKPRVVYTSWKVFKLKKFTSKNGVAYYGV